MPLRTLEELFERGKSLPAAERAAFVASCSDDPDVREELASLLDAAEEAPSFFEALGASLVPPDLQPTSTQPPGPDDVEPASPRVIGHYRIEELLGAGGMGVVYRARDLRLGREVALKFLPHHLGRDPSARRRFLAEARAAAALDHPNVCALHEVGEDADGRMFIVMGYYGGETLDRILERGRPTVKQALDWARQVASALQAAHAHGIVHRDIKPGNILIAEGGTVKLLDFGLAKLGDATLTDMGKRQGTVAYMSPEQTRGGKIRSETDLWSLGVVLYEMLAGRRPFDGGNTAVVLEAIREDRPAPPSIPTDELPAGVEAMVLGLLSPDPDSRRRPFRALLGEMETVGGDLAPSRTRSWRRMSVVGASAAVALAAGIVLLRKPAEPKLPEIRRLAVIPFADSTHSPEERYVVEGLHQATIDDLTRSGAVTVSSTDAVERYRNGTRPVPEIARDLGVDAVVEGAVWRSGDSLRVELSLRQGESGAPVWTGRYVGSARGELLALPSRISAGIVAALGTEAAGPSASAVSRADGHDPRAERAYLRGLYELRVHKDQDPSTTGEAERHVRAAIADFKEALTIEPDWAAAHAQLASAYHWLVSGMAGSDSSYYWGASKEEAFRALSLDESEAGGFASLGFALFAEHNWAQAEPAMRRAIELEPSSENHWAYAKYLLAVARDAESIDHWEEAERRDPVSLALKGQMAVAYVCAGRYDEAVSKYRQILPELGGPATDGPRLWMAYAYARAGKYREAGEVLDEAIALSDSSALDVAALAYVEAQSGATTRARALLRRLDERSPGWEFRAFSAPAALAAVGERERAVAAFLPGIKASWDAPLNMRCGWSYPVLKDDPRIRKIEQSMHFPDNSISARGH